jgi:hypothetical protein
MLICDHLCESRLCSELLRRRERRVVSRACRQQKRSVLRRRHDGEDEVGVASLLRKRLVHQVRVSDHGLLHVDQFDGVLQTIWNRKNNNEDCL